MAECHSWHRLGEQCRSCGIWTVPARFYWEGKEEVAQQEADRRYLAWAANNLPGFANKVQTVSVSEPANTPAPANKGDVCSCGRPARPRGTDCWRCYRERRHG